MTRVGLQRIAIPLALLVAVHAHALGAAASSLRELAQGQDPVPPSTINHQPPTSPDLPPDGSFLRITVDGGVSPFSSVFYDVTVRGRTAVLSLVKESLCYNGQHERVVLLEGDRAAAVLAALRDAGAWRLEPPARATAGRARDHAAPRDAPRYEFWSGWGRDLRRFHLPGAALAGAPDALRVLTALRDAVTQRVDPLPMRDLFHPADKLGFLTMTANETARATLDGWDVVKLPVDALELVEGEHRVRVEGESGRVREFTVRVAAGTTSRVHVVLEDE